MGVPAASLSARNLRLSVQRRLREAWAEPEDLLVGWGEAEFDPDALRAEAAPASVWAAVQWVSGNSGGGGGGSLLQVDICSGTDADPSARAVLRLADSLDAALRSASSLPIYDFSAVLSAGEAEVLISGNRILLQAEGGRLGARSDMSGPLREAEVWRVTVSYRFRLLSDASPALLY